MLAAWTFLKSPLGLSLVAALAVAGGIWFVFHKGETAGATGEVAKIQARTKEVQGKINDAQSAGPRTPSDVSKLLRAGTF